MHAPFKVAVGEMHILAYCYHWPPDILWDMPRSERRMWAEMVRLQKEVEADSIKGSGSKAPSKAKHGKGYKESS